MRNHASTYGHQWTKEINRDCEDVDSRYDGCGSNVVYLELKLLKGNFPL